MDIERSITLKLRAVGVQAYPPKAFPKLPATLFRDVRPRGSLFVIASTCARTMLARSLKKLDFSNPALRKQVCSHRRQLWWNHSPDV